MSGGAGGGEKTEKPTPKKLKDLRKKGSVARSIELPQAVALVVAVALLPSAIGRLGETLTASMTMALSSSSRDLSVAYATTAAMVEYHESPTRTRAVHVPA